MEQDDRGSREGLWKKTTSLCLIRQGTGSAGRVIKANGANEKSEATWNSGKNKKLPKERNVTLVLSWPSSQFFHSQKIIRLIAFQDLESIYE